MEKSDIKIKSYEIALSWSKHITTLSTGTLILSATFLKNVLDNGYCNENLLVISWILYGASILFGFFFIGFLNGSLADCNSDSDVEELDIYKGTPRILGLLQVLPFIAGMILFIIFASKNI